MTREQFDKAETIVNELDIVKKQLEIAEFYIRDLSESSVDYEKIVTNMRDITECLINDNPNGKHVVCEVVKLMKNLLTEQLNKLDDELKII